MNLVLDIRGRKGIGVSRHYLVRLLQRNTRCGSQGLEVPLDGGAPGGGRLQVPAGGVSAEASVYGHHSRLQSPVVCRVSEHSIGVFVFPVAGARRRGGVVLASSFITNLSGLNIMHDSNNLILGKLRC